MLGASGAASSDSLEASRVVGGLSPGWLSAVDRLRLPTVFSVAGGGGGGGAAGEGGACSWSGAWSRS
eukprot:13058360-Alexandrium_andersonii.AAC.1